MPDNIKDVLSNSTKLPASWNKADEPSKPAPEPIKHSLGDQDCPVCHGIGFVYKDVPLTHPDYGKMVVCECRQRDVRQLERKRLYELSNLGAFSDKTFETFQIQGNSHLSDREKKSLEDAYEAVHNYASHPENGWLVLLGKYGCGKTHLAAAVANLVVDIGIPTIFLTVPDLLDWLRNSYGSKEANFEDRFTELRTVKLLVLDDLGTQNATEWAKEKLFQIINYRYVNNLPTIVTSNENIDRLDGRIKSRLQDTEKSTIIHINAGDYRNPKALAGNQFLL
ncbi:MAG: ATP-binding protein, partial [Anaerolineaceae bacterium]|nr:ATP-binding protein [Anaerolineaceae bacterium]